MKARVIFLFLLLFALASCNKPEAQRLEHVFSNSSWHKFTEMQWDIDFPKGDAEYILSMELVVNERFKEENIRVQLIVESKEGESRNQGISYPLSAFSQKEENEALSNTLTKDLSIAGKFKAGSSYHIELVSLMPHLDTPGIEQLSLVFTPIDG
jgi:hypothetical protein